MKGEIDEMIAQYGTENAPPPWSTFTIPNDIKEGNLHVVQKVFEGAFEVSFQPRHWLKLILILHHSSISCTLLARLMH